jgi:hypothetical protein
VSSFCVVIVELSYVMRSDKHTKICDIDLACFLHQRYESICCSATREIVLHYSISCLNTCFHYEQGYDVSMECTVYNCVSLIGRKGGCFKDPNLDSLPYLWEDDGTTRTF